jgi:hypothetical protein
MSIKLLLKLRIILSVFFQFSAHFDIKYSVKHSLKLYLETEMIAISFSILFESKINLHFIDFILKHICMRVVAYASSVLSLNGNRRNLLIFKNMHRLCNIFYSFFIASIERLYGILIF